MASLHAYWRGIKFLTIALALVLGVCTSGHGQTAGYSNLNGVVLDEKGAAVPGAKMAVRNTATGVSRDLVTDSQGEFRAPQIPPGIYEVIVEAQGFATLKRTSIPVEVGATVTLQLELKVATVTQEVTVTSQVGLLEPEKVESSQTITQTLVSNLPINGRRWENFVLLTPAVTTDGPFGLVSYRGISGIYNNNTVDGADNNQAFFSESRGRTRIAYAYSQQTIQEFQVTNSNYSAEFGRAAGGIVNAVTKSGGNEFHGGAFWYLRQFHANALDSLQKSRGNFTKPEKLRNQFGADFGGPIVKDKLFFYGAYDGQRRSFPGAATAFPPNYFDPTTGIATMANCLAARGGPSQQQCTNAIAFLHSLVGPFPRRGNQDIGFGKMDWQPNTNNRISGSLNWHNWRGPNAFNSSTPSNNGNDDVRTRFVVVDWTSTYGSSKVNDLRFQYGKDFEADTPNSGGPAVSISGLPTYGEYFGLPRPFYPDERRWQWTDGFSLIHGRHTFKAGVELNFVHEKLANLFNGNGNYRYSGNRTVAFQNWVTDVFNLPDGTNTGKHYSGSFVQAVDPITGIGRDDFWNHNVGAYFQGTWKLRSNLTLNYGLRYDIQLVPQPPKPNTASPLLTLYTSTINIDKNNFGPRLALAWQANPKTVARIGYGLYYGQTSNSTFYSLRRQNGVFQQSFSCFVRSSCGPTFPNLIFTPPGPTPAAPFPLAQTPTVVNTSPTATSQLAFGLVPDFVNPVVHMGEVAIERQLPWGMTISGTYLFSRGLRLPVFVDKNLAPATTTRTYDVTDSSGTTVSQITVPFYTSRIDAQTGTILVGSSVINSWYHAFVLSLQKRYTSGLELLANFTLSKAIDNGEVIGTDGTFTGTNVPVDPKNLKPEKALSDLDQRKRFVTSFVYTPPFFHTTSSAFLRKMFDGLGFSGILTLADGRPVTPFMNSSPDACAFNGGVTCGDVGSHGTPDDGRAPQLGRNTFTSPGLTVFDLRVQRDIHFHERYALRVAVEAFNLTNTTNVTDVNNSAFDLVSSGGGVCTAAKGHATNDCIVPTPSLGFLTPSFTSNNIYGARQMQLSLRFSW